MDGPACGRRCGRPAAPVCVTSVSPAADAPVCGRRCGRLPAPVCVASASPCGRRCGGLPATRPAVSPLLRGVNTFSVSFFCPSGTLDTAAPQFSQNLAVGSSACPHCGQYRIFPITAPLSFCQFYMITLHFFTLLSRKLPSPLPPSSQDRPPPAQASLRQSNSTTIFPVADMLPHRTHIIFSYDVKASTAQCSPT